MINSFSLILMGFVFMFILLLCFLLREHVRTQELNLYKRLITFNCIGLFFEMLSTLTIRYLSQNNPITILVNRFYLLYFVFFMALLSAYSYLVSNGGKKYDLLIKKHKAIFYAVVIISILAVFTLPIELNYGDAVYSYGVAVNFIYIYSFLNVILCIGIILKNIRNIKSRKYIPLIVYIIGSGLVGIIQKMYPELTLSTTMDAVVLFIMYFTIENPDMKMLEESHRAKEISDSANEEKTLFLYNMTQEIRSITNKIDDAADSILDSKDYEEIHNSARDIKANTSKFTNMANDILDVSNIDSSTIKVYNNKYNIKNVLKQVINVYDDLCKRKELKFITNIDHDIPEELYGDSISLKEVLNTILNNSVKYTTKGYVELSVNTIIKNDICRLIMTIEDSGVGIKSEDINAIKVNDKSLARANKMITLMNGTMLISSDYGVGTKVKVILDQKIEVNTDTEVSKYESIFDNNLNILCVDDSDAGLKIIDKLLRGTKIKLDIADNGKECIDKIRVNKYNLILLDEELSQIKGSELMSKIKEIRNFNIPVVLLTKDNSHEYNEEYIKLGFCDYILKPIKKEDLLDKINKNIKKGK